MESNCWLNIGTLLLSAIALIGFFVTKKPGYGRYSTSTFLLLVALIFAGNLFLSGKIESSVIGNVFFAIIGFAGGLLSQKESTDNDQ